MRKYAAGSLRAPQQLFLHGARRVCANDPGVRDVSQLEMWTPPNAPGSCSAAPHDLLQNK